nr:transmembrane protein DDB_G0273707/DDB_G0273361-like [Ipomoea batatas]
MDGCLKRRRLQRPLLSATSSGLLQLGIAGAFAAMAILGKIDQMLAPKGVSITIAPLGAVCAVLFATPSSPGARKYNMFLAQIGCAAFGVLAFTIFGPGWLARSSALAASIAFMIYTRAVHPPAASLPILFIDAAKLHQLNYWYVLFPGATGCILLCVIVSFSPITPSAIT